MSSNPTPLTATPSSAKALAAAGAGETVALRMSVTAPEGAILTAIDDCVYACDVLTGEVTDVLPPVAEGERVAVRLQSRRVEAVENLHELAQGKQPDYERYTVHATVLATPTPERWCEEAEMDCSLETLEAAGRAVQATDFCRECRENLLHVWRVEVRREGGRGAKIGGGDA